MTKDEAHKQAIRLWRELPVMERQTYTQAQVFAASLAEKLDFRTMGNERKVIAAWLVRDIIQTQAAGRADPPGASSKGAVVPLKDAAMHDRDLTADNDESPLVAPLKSENKRAGAG